jgi:C-terminal processing protease CtpA/Prc
MRLSARILLNRNVFPMHTAKLALALGCAAMMLSSCGGDDGGTGGGTAAPAPTPTAPAPTPTTSQCSLSARQDFALNALNEWYLFPDLLATGVNKAAYTTVDDYIDALVAPARAQSRDRFFTYLTSIAEENAFYEQGASAGFGFRLSYDTVNGRVYVLEAFEGTPALAAGLDRGSEILEIQAPGGASQSVSTLIAQGGAQAVVNALGPNAAGTTRVLTFRDPAGTVRSASITKAEYAIDPVSDRYGARVINDGGKLVGYINLRTFIDTAEPDLVAAFDQFRQQGVTELIIDFRYNGGGLVSIAELMGDLMGAGRQGQVFSYTTFRPSKSSQNETYAFAPRQQSIQPTKIAFIGTGGTASASELVINSMQPYLASNMALIGDDTYGKPVGQIAVDRAPCDDRLRVVAFRTENANRQGDYYTGLASIVSNTCAATDDYTHQLGDPQEAMVARALDFLAGRSCTPISASQARTASVDGAPGGRRGDGRQLLMRQRGGTTDREVPGSF